MKITNITGCLNFMAGKVHVYSDFDGTYCPAKHSSLHIDGENSFMKDYCSKIDSFIKSTEGDLHMHITTGRTFGEYEAVSHLLKLREFHLPLPESFISKNGSDEFIKNGSDVEFYENGVFPYKYSEPNKLKEKEIKKHTNWDGENLRNFIKDLSKKYHLKLIEADSENSVRDYGNNSLFSDGKLNPDEWKKLPHKDGKIAEHKIPIADFVLGARKDGNLKINLIFSPDYGYCPERNYIYDNFMNEIKKYLKANNVEYAMEWETPNKHNHYRNHCNITPRINNSALTKLFDTKQALAKAIKENDMVVVAGDGSNDFDMLNPLEYIEKSDWEKYKSEGKCQYFYEADMKNKLSLIHNAFEGKDDKLKQELESNGLIKQIKKLPLYSVIINKDNQSLKLIQNAFERFGKVITVDNAKLDDGITSAIRNYASEKNSFMAAMSDKFKTYIIGTTKKKDYKNLIYSAIAISTAGGLGVIYKNTTGTKNESITNQKN